MKRFWALMPAVLFLAACAGSQVPTGIDEQPRPPLAVAEVQQSPERFKGREVRWGGTIIAVHNREERTEIELLSRPLSDKGKPLSSQPGEGRFLALLTGFADPAEYPEKRLLTVTGTIEGVAVRPIGEFPYTYPLVRVHSRHLWPAPRPAPPPYYRYDPWYYPWYRPWGGPWYW